MLGPVTVVACAFMVPLLTSTTVHAQNVPFNVEDLLGGDLTRSSNFGTTFSPCQTPENQQGLCRSAVTCKPYLPLLNDLRNNTVIDFFRQRVCSQGSGFVHVCCPRQTPTPKPTPPTSQILFNQEAEVRPQPPRGNFHSPSQRPNARRPAQGGFGGDNDDNEDERRDSMPIHPPPTFRPQPPPSRPTTLPTTTTTTRPPPLGTLLPSTGFFMRPDREPDNDTQNPPNPAAQNQNPTPTEPPVPSILPAEGECGTTPQGQTGTMPWIVGLGLLEKEEFRVLCWAALVSRQHVIAAAHCLHPKASTHVRLGDMMQHQGNTLDIPLVGWVHPDYNTVTRENDLALITLASPVTLTDNIQPVCLPFRYRFDGFRGQQLQVLGWGGAGNLEAGGVEVIGLGQCREVYKSPSLISNNEVAPFSRPSSSSSSSFSLAPRSSSNVVVDKRHLCASAAPSASAASSCLSANGAPLIFHDEDTTGLYFLAGVSSHGDTCAEGPGLYTRVGAFMPWLAKRLSDVENAAPHPPPRHTRNAALN